MPGVSIEDQRVRYRVDRPILSTVVALILAFVVWGGLSPQGVLSSSTAAGACRS